LSQIATDKYVAQATV